MVSDSLAGSRALSKSLEDGKQSPQMTMRMDDLTSQDSGARPSEGGAVRQADRSGR
jgi:hypothetical protein